MRFFDAHCDTIQLVIEGKHDFRTGDGVGQVSLPGLEAAGSCAQVLACCVSHRDFAGLEYEAAERMLVGVTAVIEESDGRLSLALTSQDLGNAYATGRVALLAALEGADPLQGRADSLQKFHALGVRSLMPAWSDNEFAGSAFGKNEPLTLEGERLIELAEELRIVVDVSHLSDAAFAGVCRLARRPFIASHSNCRSVCDSPRNLTDAMIRELADRGGVMGINLFSGFVDPVYLALCDRPIRKRMMRARADSAEGRDLVGQMAAFPRPPLEGVVRHVLHAIDVGGEDCIGLGGDLDGSPNLPQGIDSIADYGRIALALERAGLHTDQVEKVCYRNFVRVYCDVLAAESATRAK